jgi:hypothetical protein
MFLSALEAHAIASATAVLRAWYNFVTASGLAWRGLRLPLLVALASVARSAVFLVLRLLALAAVSAELFFVMIDRAIMHDANFLVVARAAARMVVAFVKLCLKSYHAVKNFAQLSPVVHVFVVIVL